MPTDWEAQYRAGDMPWEKGAPSPALLEALQRVPISGRALVPGCGLGHDVRALAAAGVEVLGLDISPSAVELADAQPRVGQERYQLGDLFALPKELCGAFDWVFEHTCYCAIQPEQRAAYVEACARALIAGGQFLGIFYLDPGQLLPREGPPYETTLASLDRHFAAHFELQQEWSPRRAYPGREGREWVRVYRRK